MVSVVIPCYNAADDVGEAIRSVLQQSRDDLIGEVIIVDDGSTDRSRAVIEQLSASDDRIRYVFQENQGPSAARNTGVAHCSHEYVAFLDADDLWLERKVEAQVAFMRKHPEVGLLYTDAFIQTLDGNRRRITATHFDYRRSDNLERLFTKGGPILTPTVIVQARCFRDAGGFDPSLPKGQDTDLWLRIAAEYPIHRLPEPFVLVRRREGSVASNAEEKAKYLRQITDKIIDRYPRLEQFRDQREAMLNNYVGAYWLRNGDRKRAAKLFWKSILLDKKNMRAYLLLALALLPVGGQAMRGILGAIGRAKNRMMKLVR